MIQPDKGLSVRTWRRPGDRVAGGRRIHLSRVVAAIDLSPLGRRVADRARIIAEQHGLPLVLVHAVDPAEFGFLDREERAAFMNSSRLLTESLVEWVEQRTSAPVEAVIAEGSAARQVVKHAKDADIIVAGTSSLDAERVGPITKRLARKARVGVVAVRRQPRSPYRRVLAAVDLSDRSSTAVELARWLAPEGEVVATYSLPARFDTVLRQSGMEESQIAEFGQRRLARATDAMEEFVGRWNDVKPQVLTGPPAASIDEEVRRRSVNLVTVGSRGAGGSSMVLLGAVAEAILDSVPCDVGISRVEGSFRRP